MRHGALLNGPLTALIGDLGHSDKIMIVDAGWPIPKDLRYDICLTHGIPRLTDVFSVIAEELSIETVIIDSEMQNHGPEVYGEVCRIIAGAAAASGETIKVENEPHVTFKEHAKSVKGIIRTGECIPYCNLVIVAGLAFTPARRRSPL
ncbi:D-ribose pyranase [Shinella yambaruensis]|uniref:D-ribose pyranase n=2 Tax=Shinella yambaruensis TaxID=415996 RepID=A0ABQ5ZSZ2_9HYPH|nr:D-ribose pyranase [Shinella yambaruensis]MCJ8028829.1 D-ribose pyranase [Shinella yambaruensis]MCU7981885.1 D-ribose pyranase [Shinella yambaruensis]GLR54859.1 D-ribose pyranase [Shinella yambaruensis]